VYAAVKHQVNVQQELNFQVTQRNQNSVKKKLSSTLADVASLKVTPMKYYKFDIVVVCCYFIFPFLNFDCLAL